MAAPNHGGTPTKGVALVMTRSFAWVVAATMAIAIACSSCSKKPVALTGEDKALAKQLGFDQDVALLVKQETGKVFVPLENFDGKVTGLQVDVARSSTMDVVFRLGEKLRPMGYQVFQSEANFESNPDRVGIVRSADQFDILRFRGTDGINYDITNEDLVGRLQEWEKKYPFRIIGADFDWVEIEFDEAPGDVESFAAEVYEFCPDAVDQGVGSVEALAQVIADDKTLFLWWD